MNAADIWSAAKEAHAQLYRENQVRWDRHGACCRVHVIKDEVITNAMEQYVIFPGRLNLRDAMLVLRRTAEAAVEAKE